jgi:acetyltransferase-like isoleucine patch superfamily enzyme
VFDDADVPVKDQGVRSVGVVVGADVWIGANACVLGAFYYHTGPRTTASAR